MRYESIQDHLRPYVIVKRRKTTINHAFAAAIAPSDEYDKKRVRAAIRSLGQDPDADLQCSYCGSPAETWDHVFATALKGEFSGHGHRLGNLLPCCKPCNSKKGNKSWADYLNSAGLDPEELQRRSKIIAAYIEAHTTIDVLPEQSAAYAELQDIRRQVLELLHRADQLAAEIRAQVSA